MNEPSNDLSGFYILSVLLLGPILYIYHTFFRSKIRKIDVLEAKEKELDKEVQAGIVDAKKVAVETKAASTKAHDDQEKKFVDELNDRYVEASDPDSVNKFLKDVGKKMRDKDG